MLDIITVFDPHCGGGGCGGGGCRKNRSENAGYSGEDDGDVSGEDGGGGGKNDGGGEDDGGGGNDGGGDSDELADDDFKSVRVEMQENERFVEDTSSSLHPRHSRGSASQAANPHTPSSEPTRRKQRC